ncbi:abnormal chemosensory protein 6 isoform X2 [Brevipalpus obovatus]|uniref:abnormal chemosensory protein 6 isoform X2 n=1 Tax=Brevipalpus obovatus TaxID=246614 RepID=UPI003D9EFE7C
MNSCIVKTSSPCFSGPSVGSLSVPGSGVSLPTTSSPAPRTYSPTSPAYTPSSLHYRDMRRHCTPIPTSHHSSVTGPGNIFSGGLDAAAELHDLSNRHHGNIKSDVSSMCHHHVTGVAGRQHHPSEMHDFLTGDPMSGSLPVAIAAAASDPSHYTFASYGPQAGHPHHSNSVNSISNLSSQSSYSNNEALLVNGMISGFHHHPAASQISAAHQMQSPFHHAHHHSGHHNSHHHNTFTATPPHHVATDPGLLEADPRELEAFAERFKQRRIKLGVTQADVGRALANLKMPGVGSLSQSTICRFESLTLSHNNMVALKPILHQWLEAAENQARKARSRGDGQDCPNVLPSSDKKRKRTSIAAPEKRSLEAYFVMQPRPSGEKIAAIAEKLELKKNVVRVWFCNQRQKQKRMKYSAVNGDIAPLN